MRDVRISIKFDLAGFTELVILKRYSGGPVPSLKPFAILPFLILMNACSSGEFSAQESLVEQVTLVKGTYVTSCYAYFDGSFDSKTVVTSTDIITTNTQYHDGSCSVPRREFFNTQTYKIVGISWMYEDTYEVNIVEGKMFITPFTTTAVTELNGLNHCGHNDWQINVPMDISGNQPCQVNPEGTLVYSIARSINDTLELGIRLDYNDPLPGSSENYRLTQLGGPSQKQ